ncbi:DNA/RNA non-specific endonuclease [Cupriavidus numazuensis]|uniref:Endonuclease n=1 Tax=Cupriavidus numazuensis TaxID=221992 RepID=A0ABM8TTN2_9BURK|nr:DNA/RNA non-specific endonuclease [Cupriavidus numazuensis]CAG2159724.1 hypothetical protein LMG26411_06928 [Cupriavidus numazuensis]
MLRTSLVAALIALAPVAASAKELAAACDYTLAQGQPVLTKPAGRTQLLCYRAYAVLYSSQTRTALWSAERLTRETVDAARQLPRDSDFYEEGRLPVADRARLADYGHGTGYDRGHLAPSGDFGDKDSQAESFSLANVIPQNSVSNRRTWSHIETSTRRLVRKVGTAYVVTGPAFRDVGELRSRIRVPDFVWKAIYVPGAGAAAYVVRNDETPAYSVISIDELAHFTGVDAFPALPKALRGTALDLPAPTPHPGEKVARRVAFARLASGEAIGTVSGVESSAPLVRHTQAILALAAAFAR